MRRAIVAGQFYPLGKKDLDQDVKSFLRAEQDEKVKALVVPHAGYVYSGKCAGNAYSKLPKSQTYVLVGVNHTGQGKNIAVSMEDFENSLGIVENDRELGRGILKNLNEKESEEAHKQEHSLEVQLPFLQTSQQNFKIVPIVLGELEAVKCKELAKAIYESAKKLNRKIIGIASSDFTHSGPAYGFFGKMEADKDAIKEIEKLDSVGFLEKAKQTTICGASAIATIIELAKLMGAKKGVLLDYYDSSKVYPSPNKVGYAAIAFY